MTKKKNGKCIVKRNGIENDNRYEGIIRTEVRLRNRRMNYEKHEHGVLKELENYYNEETEQDFFESCIEPIFGTSRFYRIDVAKKIVCENVTNKYNWQNKLCGLLEYIRENGYRKSKEEYGQNFYTYRDKLEELGINCLTFDEHFKQESMDNFTLIENGTNTDLEMEEQ